MQDRDPFAVGNVEAMPRRIGMTTTTMQDAAQEIGFNKININCRARMAIRRREAPIALDLVEYSSARVG